jgi:hypothetical protein
MCGSGEHTEPSLTPFYPVTLCLPPIPSRTHPPHSSSHAHAQRSRALHAHSLNHIYTADMIFKSARTVFRRIMLITLSHYVPEVVTAAHPGLGWASGLGAWFIAVIVVLHV